jgi:hypothetical protein
MKRLHVHVAVDNLEDSIRFYSSLFANEPTVQKGDYAKWMLDDPRVNFAISQRGAQSGLNHLGIQVESDAELNEMQSRLKLFQPTVEKEENVYCCYAKSEKYWVKDPQGIAWETFRTLDSIPVFGEEPEPHATGDSDSSDQSACAVSCCMPSVPLSTDTRKCC